MVTSGKGRSATGWGVMVVDTGESDHTEKEDWMMNPAQANPRRTITNQTALAFKDLLVEI